MNGLFLLFLGGLVLTAGDIVMKEWALKGGTSYFLQGLAIWTVGLVFLALSFKYKNMAAASAIFVIVNVVSLALISWLHYDEPLSKAQVAGVGLAIVAVFLLE